MISEETLKIIKDCNLSRAFVDKLKRDYVLSCGHYTKRDASYRTNMAVKEWYDKLIENRRRLLYNTPYWREYENLSTEGA